MRLSVGSRFLSPVFCLLSPVICFLSADSDPPVGDRDMPTCPCAQQTPRGARGSGAGSDEAACLWTRASALLHAHPHPHVLSTPGPFKSESGVSCDSVVSSQRCTFRAGVTDSGLCHNPWGCSANVRHPMSQCAMLYGTPISALGRCVHPEGTAGTAAGVRVAALPPAADLSLLPFSHGLLMCIG